MWPFIIVYFGMIIISAIGFGLICYFKPNWLEDYINTYEPSLDDIIPLLIYIVIWPIALIILFWNFISRFYLNLLKKGRCRQ